MRKENYLKYWTIFGKQLTIREMVRFTVIFSFQHDGISHESSRRRTESEEQAKSAHDQGTVVIGVKLCNQCMKGGGGNNFAPAQSFQKPFFFLETHFFGTNLYILCAS